MAAATIRAFAEGCGAARVVLLLDEGERPATLVEWAPGGPVAVTAEEEAYAVAADADALPLQPPRPVPASAIQLDPEGGEVAAPLGAVAGLAAGVLELAQAFGGLTVATADFPTAHDDLPLTIAAREGEPVVLAMGDRQFALPEGWPA